MFNSPKLITFFILVLSSLMAVSCNGPADANGEVAAKVGSREITIKQIDSVIKEQLNQTPGATLNGAGLVAARLTVLDSLIQEAALFERAKKENLVPDDNKVNQEIQKKKVDAHMTEDEYLNQLKSAGLSEAEYRERVAKDLAITALTDKEKARVTAPTDEEIKKAFDENKTQFVAERGADISVIVTNPQSDGRSGDAVGDAAAEQKIRSIYDQLKRGSDFATVAQRSEDQSYIRGGQVGFASEAALKQQFASLPQLAQRLMSMGVGEYTEPLKEPTSGTWLIVKLNSKRETKQEPRLDDEVRRSIIDTLTQQRVQVLMTALIMVAKSEATVKYTLPERLLANPQTIVQMRPSALLDQPGTASQPQQPAPRIENENQNKPASNSNSSQPRNASR